MFYPHPTNPADAALCIIADALLSLEDAVVTVAEHGNTSTLHAITNELAQHQDTISKYRITPSAGALSSWEAHLAIAAASLYKYAWSERDIAVFQDECSRLRVRFCAAVH